MIVAASVVAAAGLGMWLAGRSVSVQISAVDPEAKISLANALDQQWRPLEAGKTRLVKGAYYYQLATASRTKTGLIAVEDETPIVLK